MDKVTKEKIDEILTEIKAMRRDIDDLKKFKNRVLGGLAVFVICVQTMCSYIFR
jgi:hypothetical protein|nr:MAG TPA: protein of unknown function (DUF4577) [Bacteriophage sp.]